jgi:hypothetical protein
MGKTFKKQANKFDDEYSGSRSGKQSKHSNNRKSAGMRTLNSYVEEDYDDFSDEVDIGDEIFIRHTKTNDNTT